MKQVLELDLEKSALSWAAILSPVAGRVLRYDYGGMSQDFSVAIGRELKSCDELQKLCANFDRALFNTRNAKPVPLRGELCLD